MRNKVIVYISDKNGNEENIYLMEKRQAYRLFLASGDTLINYFDLRGWAINEINVDFYDLGNYNLKTEDNKHYGKFDELDFFDNWVYGSIQFKREYCRTRRHVYKSDWAKKPRSWED